MDFNKLFNDQKNFEIDDSEESSTSFSDNISEKQKRDREEENNDIILSEQGKKDDLFHSWYKNTLNNASHIHSNNELFEAEFIWEKVIEKKEVETKISEILTNNYENCDKTLMQLMDIIKKETRNEKRSSLENQKNILLQEYETWRLIQTLYENKMCIPSQKPKEIFQNESLSSFQSKYMLHSKHNQFVINNPEYKKAFLVIDWLESIEEYKTKNDPKKNFLFNKPQLDWAETFKSANSSKNIIKMIDFDAPNREMTELSRTDQKEEEKMLISIYRFLRSGQLNEAIDLCKEARQSWRAATLRGGDLYFDVNLKDQQKDQQNQQENNYEIPYGNQIENIKLWRETCTKIAENTNNPHEKAIYFLLSRNLFEYEKCKVFNKTSDGERTWQDEVWSKYKCDPLLDPLEISSHSKKLLQFNNLSYLPKPKDDLFKIIRSKLESLESIDDNPKESFDDHFQSIHRSDLSNPKLNVSNRDISSILCRSFSHIHYFLIVWDLRNLSDFLNLLIDFLRDQFSMEIRPFRKFIANLMILISHIDQDTHHLKSEKIISEYIEQLIKTNQIPLVPLYCSLLLEKNEELSTNLYAKFLTENFEKSRNEKKSSKSNKKKLMEYTKIVKLDPFSISGKMVSASPNKKQNLGFLKPKKTEDFLYSSTEKNSENDIKIQAAEWIWIDAVNDKEKYIHAFSQTNSVARAFLLNDPPFYQDLERLMSKIPLSVVESLKDQHFDMKMSEKLPDLSQEMESFLYLQISKCFSLFFSWNNNKRIEFLEDIENSLDELLNLFEFELEEKNIENHESNQQILRIRKNMLPRIIFTYDHLYTWCSFESQKTSENKHSNCVFLKKHIELSGVVVSRGWILGCMDQETHLKTLFRNIQGSAMQILKNGHSDPLDFECKN